MSSSGSSIRRPCERDGNCFTPDDALQLNGLKAKIEGDRASLYYTSQEGGTSKMTL